MDFDNVDFSGIISLEGITGGTGTGREIPTRVSIDSSGGLYWEPSLEEFDVTISGRATIAQMGTTAITIIPNNSNFWFMLIDAYCQNTTSSESDFTLNQGLRLFTEYSGTRYTLGKTWRGPDLDTSEYFIGSGGATGSTAWQSLSGISRFVLSGEDWSNSITAGNIKLTTMDGLNSTVLGAGAGSIRIFGSYFKIRKT